MRVAIIPARGGSVRLPRKNIRPFRGVPMIGHAIDVARASCFFKHVIVSTDDSEIEGVARAHGACIFWRDPDDGVRGTQEVAREVLMRWGDVTEACVIYPCSPLLTVTDLARGFNAMSRPMTQYAMSVQADPLADAGCFYWGKADAFRDGAPLIAIHTAMVPLPPERVCDINTQEDWDRAESMYDALRRAS